MRDLPVWLAGPPGAAPLRLLRNLARMLPGVPQARSQAIVIITPSGDIPPELSGHVTVIEWPLPDRAEIGQMLDMAMLPYKDNPKIEQLNGNRDAAIDAAVGLTGEEAQNCFSKSLVLERRINPVAVANEKKRVIARERVLEWYDPLPDGLKAIGGLDNFKMWLTGRKIAFTPQARAYGLRPLKGIFLLGVSGCGKSMSAKAAATEFQCPLLRMDLGALKSKFVGESEALLRKALRVIEAVGRCVVWLDEIEKMFEGATSGSADGGVAADQLATILTWMQERKGEAFVIATSNDVSKLPPELLRKGRFDELWWVDLPTAGERVAILQATLKNYGREKVKIDPTQIATACDGFTGSEIAELVPDAMFSAFADGAREITTEDLVEAAGTVVPLKDTMKEKIEFQRKWALGRARPASSPEMDELEQQLMTARVLDI
jgi:hypothetical protein